MNAKAGGVGFQVAVADDEHGVDFHLLGVRDLGLDVVGADVEFAADLMGAQFGLNRAGVVEQLSRDCGIADGEDADLLG